jgi:serine phosphatase RsbU (regulator of sigma subunit)
MGDLLGVFDNPITDVSTVDLRPGDALVCFTDGVTERRQDGRMLGEEGVAAVLESAAGVPAAALARRLQTAVTDFAETPPRDDLAILVLTAT